MLGMTAALLVMALLPMGELQALPEQGQGSFSTSGALATEPFLRSSSLASPCTGDPTHRLLVRSRRSDFEDRYRQWQNLSPEEQRELRQNYRQWQEMSPREREIYRRRHEQWQQIPPEQRRDLRRKLDNWDRLPPGEREQIRRKFMEE
jgi:hypothetical protein